MLRKLRSVAVLSLAVLVLTSLAFSATQLKLGSITLNENPFEKFGALFFPFTFNVSSLGQMWVLCEFGTVTGGGCVNGVISDAVCVNNNQANEGVAALISDLENGLSNLPPDFPCNVDSKTVFLKETGKAQVLSGPGIPTTLPGGGAGPLIKVVATSDLDPTTSTTSDTLVILAQ
jgi:hypothetical protein